MVPGAGTRAGRAAARQPWHAPGAAQVLRTPQHFALTARGTEQLQAPSPSPGPAQGGTTPTHGQAQVRSEARCRSSLRQIGVWPALASQHGRSHGGPVASIYTYPLSQCPAKLPPFCGRATVLFKTHFHPDPLEPRPPPGHVATLRPSLSLAREVLLLLTYSFDASGRSWARTS